MKTGIILQARMGSSRLPGKVLKYIGPKTILDHIIFRLSYLRHTAKVVIATSIHPRDDILKFYSRSRSVSFFRGSEQDVLERYYLCAKQYGFHHVVRLTGDNPFVDVEEVDRLIECHLGAYADYSHSFDTLPVGCGAEIFTFAALERSFFCGHKANHREHVNEYIQENPDLFLIAVPEVPLTKKRPDIRLTVDTGEDYRRACYIAEKSKDEYITTEKAVELCLEFEDTMMERALSQQESP